MNLIDYTEKTNNLLVVDYIIWSIVIISILIIISLLSIVFPKFILVALITLFALSFIFNANELIKYISESTKINSNRMLSYCDLIKKKLFDNDLIFDNSDMQLLLIYLIIFILLWSNTIANIITNNLSSEIKIIGFYKYYNKDIYDNYNYEHAILWAIMIFTAYTLVIYLFNFIYYNFLGSNLINKGGEVVSNINTLKKTIKDNVSCHYLKYYIEQIDKKNTDREKIFSDYYNLVKGNKDLYKDGADADIYLKCYITHYLFGLEERKVTNLNKTYCNDEDNYCIFNLLKGKDIYSTFPEKLNSLKYIENAIKKVNPSFDIYSAEIKSGYDTFVNTLQSSYSFIKLHERSNSFYYKLDLLFIKLSGMIFSIIAIMFFIKTEFKQFIKDMTGITIDPLEYTIEVYSTIIKLIILFVSVIFITLLFNT